MADLSPSFWSSLSEETGRSLPTSLEEEFLLVEKSQNKWDGLLEFIQQQTIQDISILTGSTEVSVSADNQSLLRFPSQLIWDKSRVVLSQEYSGSSSDFINATHLALPQIDRDYILTEAPLLNTISNFWGMVWQFKINSIIMMNQFNEKSANQIHSYMPIGAENGDTDVKEFGDYVITYDSRESVSSCDVTQLNIAQKSTALTRNMIHYAFSSWTMDTENPQHTTRCDNLMAFIFHLYSKGVLYHSDQSVPSPPVLVHCSDGLGRSGALILLDYCLQMVIRTQSLTGVKIPELLIELRALRRGVISSGDQLKTVYTCLISGANKLLPKPAVLTADFSRESDDESVDRELQQSQDVDSSEDDFELIQQPGYSSSDVGQESEHMSSIESAEVVQDTFQSTSLVDTTTHTMVETDVRMMDISENTDSIILPVEDTAGIDDTIEVSESVSIISEVSERTRAPPISEKFYSIVPETESTATTTPEPSVNEGVIKRVSKVGGDNPSYNDTPMSPSLPLVTSPTEHSLTSVSIFVYLLLPLFVVVLVILVLTYFN